MLRSRVPLLALNRLNFGNIWEFAYWISFLRGNLADCIFIQHKFGMPGGTLRIRSMKVSCSEAGSYLAFESEIRKGNQHEFNKPKSKFNPKAESRGGNQLHTQLP